jgi:hypothetical protein
MFIAWHGLATVYYLLRRGRKEEEAMREVDKLLAWARVADAGDAIARSARGLGFSDCQRSPKVHHLWSLQSAPPFWDKTSP